MLRLSGGYCPCAIKKTPDNKCLCKDFRDKIEDDTWFGECSCGFYEKVDE